MHLAKAWAAIDRLSIIWKSDLSDKIKWDFFLAAVVSILLYGCTTWTLTKRIEEKLDGNYTIMVRACLEQILEATPYKTTVVRPPTSHLNLYIRTCRCWLTCKDLDQQLYVDTGWSLEDMLVGIYDRDGWRERELRNSGLSVVLDEEK